MKLSFQLLVVDDQPDDLRSAVSILKEHLDSKGFDLVRTDLPVLSGSDWDAILNQGRSYDLVMVDYNLSQSEMGDVAAKRLRIALPYTDIIFYSAERRTELLRLLAKQQVEGVFVAHRQELDEPLVGLADAVIGKAVDLNHMRGIAMAEVAEMDLLMEELLTPVFQLDHPDISAVADKTVKKLKSSMDDESKRFCRDLGKGGLSAIVSDGRIFTLYHKYIALRRLAELLPEVHLAPKLKILKSFQDDIMKNRNLLAHVKEDSDGSGNVILRSTKSGDTSLVIDEEWMATFRRNLRKHRETLEALCTALRQHFGLAESPDDPGKDHS